MSADAQWDIVIRGLRRRSQTDEQIAYCEEIVAALRERQQRLEDALREIAERKGDAAHNPARVARAVLGESE